ncbi:MAG: transcriptional regulator [Terracidiphilus sp.]
MSLGCKCDRPRRFLKRLAFIPILFFSILAAQPLAAQSAWRVVGPDGGDARAFAADPASPGHLYLGTTNSWLYESQDAGATWHRLAKIDPADGYVLDSIVVDSANPSTLYVGAWKDSFGGGVWVSHDSGKTWKEARDLKGQPIHALIQAPSDPRTLFAGTLEGVYRTSDGGQTWALISPVGSREIHEVESLAVDPRNPGILYAGTWHLPWKTTNGGRTWSNIKKGVIVDSDIFSIIVDPDKPRIVYMSACSGIYKSEDSGVLFHKIQGIPNEARRTRVIMQDPENREIVYAGTTEGLYKTENGGRTFQRMTGPEVVVNDVYVDPHDSKHVLLATDRGGVLASTDGGENFTESNQGISERKVAALLVDRNDARHLYAGVVNDKTFGGVFESTNSGASWQQMGAGLEGRDVFALAQTKDGTVVAGSNDGIFILDPPAADSGNATNSGGAPGSGEASGPAGAALAGSGLTWEPRNTIANTIVKTFTQTHYHTKVNMEKEVKAPQIEMSGRVNALDVSGDTWAAATDIGVLTSHDQGTTWQGGPVMGGAQYRSITVHGDTIVAARTEGAAISTDSGQTWLPLGVPTMITQIHRALFSPDGTLWLAAREGVYYSHDLGKSWLWFERLPFRDVDDLSYDPLLKKMLASSESSDQVYAIDAKTMTWLWWKAGYQITLIRNAGDHLVAASLNDGVLTGPETTGAEGTGK